MAERLCTVPHWYAAYNYFEQWPSMLVDGNLITIMAISQLYWVLSVLRIVITTSATQGASVSLMSTNIEPAGASWISCCSGTDAIIIALRCGREVTHAWRRRTVDWMNCLVETMTTWCFRPPRWRGMTRERCQGRDGCKMRRQWLFYQCHRQRYMAG